MPDAGLGKSRILVVDDEPANVTILRRLLAQEGYEDVIGVTDSREVPALLDRAPPDLVLLDLLMPYLDGYRILELVAERWPDGLRPPVLVLTADTTRRARERALRAGAMDFLTKPFDHLEAVLRVRNLLAWRHLEVRLARQNERLEELVGLRTRALHDSVERLRESARHREDLLSRLVDAQEMERREIAAEVHDTVIQTLVELQLRLELHGRRLEDPDRRAESDRLHDTAARALAELRLLVTQLRPVTMESDGLEGAIRELLRPDTRADGADPDVTLVVDLAVDPPLTTQTVLYRIAQGAVSNVRRHAAARTLEVRISGDRAGVDLWVRDDGAGFDPHEILAVHGQGGLAIMDERARLAGGWLRAESAVGGGTVIHAWLPLDPEAAVAAPGSGDSPEIEPVEPGEPSGTGGAGSRTAG